MTLTEIRARVLVCKSCTVMANAFRRFFGIEAIHEKPREGAIVSVDAYEDIRACFANTASPLDGRLA